MTDGSVGRLPAGEATDASHLNAVFTHVPFEPLDQANVIEGTPSTRYVALDTTAEREVGVWEHTVGVSRDIEADEVFVVLAGDATLEFVEPALPSIELRPGVVVRLEAGMSTIWTVRETIRKVLVAP